MPSRQRTSRGSVSPLQSYFLARLSRLLKLRSEQNDQLNEGGLRLIDHTIYATYCDAVEVGVAEEAQKLLHRHAETVGATGK